MKRAYYVSGAWAYAMHWRVRSRLQSRTSYPRGFRPAVRLDPRAPALLLSPHLDDLVLSCWSVLTAGGDQRIVNIFAGVPPPGFVTKWDRASGAHESAAHVRARIAEDREVLARLGHRPAYLPFVDAQYRARPPTLAALDAAVAEVAPAARVAYAPAALGFAHRDHLLLREYARSLARHGLPVMLYADLPYAVRSGAWPEWVRAGRSGSDGSEDAFWRPALRAVPQITGSSVVTLKPNVAMAKLEAMRAYSSQFPGLDHDGRLSKPGTHSREVFWTLGPTHAASVSR